MVSITKVQDLRSQEQQNIQELFRPLLVLAKCTGLLRIIVSEECGCRTPIKALTWLLLLVFHGIIWMANVKITYTTAVVGTDNFGGFLAVLVTLVFFSGSTFISSWGYFAMSNNFTTFCESLDDHQQAFGDLKIPRLLRISSKLAAVIVTILSLVIGVMFPVAIYVNKNSMLDMLSPVSFDTYWSTTLWIIMFLLQGFATSSHQFTLLFFYAITCSICIVQFIKITKQLNGTTRGRQLSQETSVERLRQEFISLLGCFDIFNSILRHYLFTLYATFVPMVCFTLYGITRGNLSRGELFVVSSFVCMNFITLAPVVILGAVLSVKAHDSLDVLMRIDLQTATETTARSVSLFVTRLTGPVIGFTVYDMWTVDAKSILALFGTLVTYTIVMIQFSDPDSSSSCSNSNTTLTPAP